MHHIPTIGRLFFSSIASLPAPDPAGVCYGSQLSASDTRYCSCPYRFWVSTMRIEVLFERVLALVIQSPCYGQRNSFSRKLEVSKVSLEQDTCRTAWGDGPNGHECYFPGWCMECRAQLLLLIRGLLMTVKSPKLSMIIYNRTAQMNKSALLALRNCQS